MVEIALRDGSHVVAAEHAGFKLLGLYETILVGKFCTGRFEVVQGLINDCVCADVFGDGFGTAVVCD